jgi:hypothetical protein
VELSDGREVYDSVVNALTGNALPVTRHGLSPARRWSAIGTLLTARGPPVTGLMF